MMICQKVWLSSQLESLAHSCPRSLMFTAGFLLLAAGDDDLPEGVAAVRLSGRHISSVEAADLIYFGSLRVLDLSDNAVGEAAR